MSYFSFPVLFPAKRVQANHSWLQRFKESKKKIIGDAEQQSLIKAADDDSTGGEKVLGTVQLAGIHPNEWHNLKLRFEGPVITGFVNEKVVLSATNTLYVRGMAGLMAGKEAKKFSTPYFDNLLINAVGAPMPRPSAALPGQLPIYGTSHPR